MALVDFINVEGNRERSTPPAFIQIRISVSPITFFLFQTEYVNMTQFMKKYMIQTLYMDAWDLGTFYIGDQLFLGVSQLGGKSFVIYKWDSGNRYTKDLKHFLCFKCWPSYSNFSRNLESWKDHYLSLACLTGVIFSRFSGERRAPDRHAYLARVWRYSLASRLPSLTWKTQKKITPVMQVNLSLFFF